MNEILLNETQKVNASRKGPEFLDSDYDDDYIYQIESMSIEETKEKNERRKREFECEQKISYGVENIDDMKCIHDKEVNKISEFNLLHDITNHNKRAKN